MDLAPAREDGGVYRKLFAEFVKFKSSSVCLHVQGRWGEGSSAAFLDSRGVDSTLFAQHLDALGTVGGGNHFAEVQQFASVLLPDVLADLGLDPAKLILVVHSGSRGMYYQPLVIESHSFTRGLGLGQEVLEKHTEAHGADCLDPASEAGVAYMKQHDHACRWALCNRELIAHRFVEALGTTATRVLDIMHNTVSACVV